MKVVFADSFYFFALANPNDAAHARAVAFTRTYTGLLTTTGWVLTEVADGWAKPIQRRPFFASLVADLKSNTSARVEPSTDELLQEGMDLYAQRQDKEWSLTDCISFIVMRKHAILEALTGDRHFEQAGFVALLK